MRKRRRRKMSKPKREFLQRAGYSNHHHILAKSRGGMSTQSNLFCWDERRHAAYHLLFQNKTFEEAARLLIRAYQMKREVKNESPRYSGFHSER